MKMKTYRSEFKLLNLEYLYIFFGQKSIFLAKLIKVVIWYLLDSSVNKKEIVHNSECGRHFGPPFGNVLLYYYGPLLDVFICIIGI